MSSKERQIKRLRVVVAHYREQVRDCKHCPKRRWETKYWRDHWVDARQRLAALLVE